MKFLVSALLVSLTATSAVYAQKTTVREATYALLGPVRDFRTESATIYSKDGEYAEGPRVLNMTATFNEDGNRPELCLYNEKGMFTRRIEEKFKDGKQVEFANYDGAGRMWLRGVSFYDQEGRPSGDETYNGDGSLRSKSTITRNAAGQLTERAEYGANDVLLERFKNTYNDAGGLKTTEQTSYGPDGSLILKVFTNMDEKRTESLTYDRFGLLTRKSVRVNQEINEYGPDGSLRKKTLITNTGRLPEISTYNPDGTARKESQIPDEFDSHGNWIKRTDWLTDAHGRRPVKVTYRTITYFVTLKL
jgi:hypothetical protein